MNPTDGQQAKEEVTALVRRLFMSENDRNRDEADKILASGYVPITRWKGQVDRDRAETLKNVASGPPQMRRHIDRADIKVALFLNGRVAIASTLLPTEDQREDPPKLADFRNMQVFVKDDNEWKCVAWQVTKVLA